MQTSLIEFRHIDYNEHLAIKIHKNTCNYVPVRAFMLLFYCDRFMCQIGSRE